MALMKECENISQDVLKFMREDKHEYIIDW